jgi:hypothetical protein
MEAFEGRQMLATFTVTTTADSGAGSFREAITLANRSNDADIIRFAIGSGQQTISPTSPLPYIKYPVNIDATSQPGWRGSPMIELRGDKTTGDGLRVGGGNSTVKGLIINRFSGNGILLANANGNGVKGNWIGLDRYGKTAGNGQKGVVVASSSNLIGGSNPNDRNVISGNGSTGVQLYSADAKNNVVIGNFIGTDVAGQKAVANGKSGIAINGSAKNRIGGMIRGERNLISGNKEDGVVVNGAGAVGNEIVNNLIGTDITGSKAVANQWYGVEISREYNMVRRNVISGNGMSGVVLYLSSAFGNRVLGNLIGTSATGTYAIANQWRGVDITNGARNNLIGGTRAADRNVISGNKSNGVSVYQGSRNVFQNNIIGFDINGRRALGNGGDGVRLIETSTVSILGGLIGHNEGFGVHNGTSTKTTLTGTRIVNDALFKVALY